LFFNASAQVLTARRYRMQDKTLDMNFSDNLGAIQAVVGRLAVDNGVTDCL